MKNNRFQFGDRRQWHVIHRTPLHCAELITQPENLMLRCYAEYADNQWQTFCVDLYLTTQADTFKEARSNLKTMIGKCVYDDLTGDGREFSGLVMAGSAPLFYRLKYWFYVVLSKIIASNNDRHKLFTEPFPLVLSSKCNHTLCV